MTSVSPPRRLSEPWTEVDVQPGTLSEEDVAPLYEYLESAEGLVLSPGMIQDPFSDNENMRVRIGIMTDGEWVWELAWADYVWQHRVAPPNEFIEHARARGFVPPEIPLERLEEISTLVGIPQP